MASVRPYVALAKNCLRANATRLAFPMKLTFCITYWCNYRCETCNIWQMKPTDELRLEEIEQFFARSNRFSWVDLTGGEVTLRKDFVAIAEAVVKNCKNLLMLHFPTNGYLTDQIVENTRAIAKLGLEKLIITVSCDGDREMNDRIRGVEGGYDRQIETFKRLREIPGVEVVLGMTLSEKNVDHFPEAFAAARREVPDLEYRDYHVNIIHEGAYLHNEENALRAAVDADALAAASESYGALRGFGLGPVNYLERTYLQHVRAYLETGKTPMKCHALRSSCFIDSWGNVMPCTIWDKKLGNLRDVDYDLASIWNRAETAGVQQQVWRGDCPQCWTPCEAYQSIMGNFLRPG
ncbi:MAG: radical SAM protein [Myxococcota bacterium]|jgi:MoaA/NifB/PqqE/SkfB family radical SAM enzyme|nr:radical SAM protein [Myxococcota bacterium]